MLLIPFFLLHHCLNFTTNNNVTLAIHILMKKDKENNSLQSAERLLYIFLSLWKISSKQHSERADFELFQNNGIYMLHWFQGKSLCESSITSASGTRAEHSQEGLKLA